MDCGTCESASPIILEQPQVVSVNLTITDKAHTMLTDAFGNDKDIGEHGGDIDAAQDECDGNHRLH